MEALVKLVGQSADTGGSQTEGTLAAKGNAILEALENALKRGTVRNLQRGICNIVANQKSVTIALSGFTDINKMIVFYHAVFPDTNTSTNVGDVIMSGLTTGSCKFINASNNANKRTIEYQIAELW